MIQYAHSHPEFRLRFIAIHLHRPQYLEAAEAFGPLVYAGNQVMIYENKYYNKSVPGAAVMKSPAELFTEAPKLVAHGVIKGKYK
jgi:hypothetical protein